MNLSQVAEAVACLKIASPDGEVASGVNLPPSAQPVVTPVTTHFSAAYLVDEGASLSYVTEADLTRTGVKHAYLYLQGLNNLARRANGLRMQKAGAMNMLQLDGHFEASLVLLDKLWDQSLAAYAPNGAVVACPARDVLAFCDVKSPEGIGQLKELAAKVYADGAHTLSDKLHVRQGGKWDWLA